MPPCAGAVPAFPAPFPAGQDHRHIDEVGEKVNTAGEIGDELIRSETGMTPLVTIQLLGLSYQRKLRRAPAPTPAVSAAVEELIELC